MNEILKTIVQAIQDKKGDDIVAINVSNVNPIVGYYIICESTNERQSLAIASEVEQVLAKMNYPIHHVEGRNGDKKWILVDANDFIVHIFEINERARYKLETLWGDQPHVNIDELMKTDGAKM